MASINFNNYGILEGRVVRDPKAFTNNGGTAYVFTLAIDRNYTDKSGKTPTDFVDVKGFVSKSAQEAGKGRVYDYIKKGNTVQVAFTVESFVKANNGDTEYGRTLRVTEVHLVRSSKANFENRQAENQVPAPAQAATPAVASAPVQTVADSQPF